MYRLTFCQSRQCQILSVQEQGFHKSSPYTVLAISFGSELCFEQRKKKWKNKRKIADEVNDKKPKFRKCQMNNFVFFYVEIQILSK